MIGIVSFPRRDTFRYNERLQPVKPYLRITLWYLLFGGLWIFITDRLLNPLSDNVDTLTVWQTAKGWVYILASGGLIFFLTRGACKRQEDDAKKRAEEFKRTVRQSHHILLNYFNQMQLFFIEADRSEDFDKNLLGLARQVTDEAEEEVLKLEHRDLLESTRPPKSGKS